MKLEEHAKQKIKVELELHLAQKQIGNPIPQLINNPSPLTLRLNS